MSSSFVYLGKEKSIIVKENNFYHFIMNTSSLSLYYTKKTMCIYIYLCNLYLDIVKLGSALLKEKA